MRLTSPSRSLGVAIVLEHVREGKPNSSTFEEDSNIRKIVLGKIMTTHSPRLALTADYLASPRVVMSGALRQTHLRIYLLPPRV